MPKEVREKAKEEERKMDSIKQLMIILGGLIILAALFFLLFKLEINLQSKTPLTGRDTFGYVSVTIVPQCTYWFYDGWNFFSLCANASNKTINATLQNITSYRYVMRWNTTRMEFDIYSPRAAENPFDSMDVNESYFVLLYNEELFSVFGPENPDMNITMVQGWDAPSWPYLFDTNVTKYLDPSKHRYMMKWDNPTQEFLIYSPRAAENPFTKIFKGEGQFLYAYSAHTLEYNKTNLSDP
ncbi:MAG: hypothetical protein K6T16_00670 [Candidatus Pacearchaeota archaeon]|nr:hypothetical protein [Candidatus Pacearchaeota archaeon]